MRSKYFKRLDIIRLISCIGVLLYHLNILKGGYLFVCTFFVLSGYLSVCSLNKDDFSIKNYYLKRLKKIYIPLLLVTLITLSIVNLIPNINWISLKPETTSVLLGYNNFWQLSANLDYFAHHINSPFMHMWYISILIQFDIIFPIVFSLIKKIGNKSKFLSCLTVELLVIIFTMYFCMKSKNENMMFVYYNSFTRLFSLLFGVLIGFIHSDYKLIVIKNNIFNKLSFIIYIVVLISLSVIINSTNKNFALFMIIITIISCRLIDYSMCNTGNLNIFDKVIKYISSMSYEIYLVQYPVIFIFQSINNSNIFLIILTIFISSLIIHIGISGKVKVLKYIIIILLCILSINGIYVYFSSKDHTSEMKLLEEQLNQNEEIMKQKQVEYENKIREEENNWQETLKQLESSENDIKNVVSNLNVVGVGDSVMLGALDELYKVFPNGYFDAQVSRTAWVANGILRNLSNTNMLGEPIIINLGANGDCPDSIKIEIMNICGNRKVFWLNVTNDSEVSVNADLENFSKKYDNFYVIDWASISKGHYEYFVADGIHLTEIGKKTYAEAIYNSIYDVYLDEYNKMKEKMILEHEENLKNKITFYGNDLLSNLYEKLQDNWENANYVVIDNYDSLKEKIINTSTLSNKIVFIFDNTFKISKKEYEELLKLCGNSKVYILFLDKDNMIDSNENITSIYFDTKNYLMIDGVHLNDNGNEELTKLLIDTITE